MCGWAFFEAQLGSCTSALYKPSKARCSDRLEGIARTAIGIRGCCACAFPDPRPFYPRKRTSRSPRWTSARGQKQTNNASSERSALFPWSCRRRTPKFRNELQTVSPQSRRLAKFQRRSSKAYAISNVAAPPRCIIVVWQKRAGRFTMNHLQELLGSQESARIYLPWWIDRL